MVVVDETDLVKEAFWMNFVMLRRMRRMMIEVFGCKGRSEVAETSLRHIRRLAVSLALLMSFPLMAMTVKDDDAVWVTVDCENKELVELYLREFPEGRHATEAKGCIAWQKTKDCEDIGLVEAFLKEYPDNRYAEEARACLARLEEDRRRNDRVERMLSECRAHYGSHRLTRGSGGNALDCYRKVLDLEPGNDEALSGIESIERYYIERAESALEGSLPDDALSRIERLQSINPEHPQVEELKGRVDDLRERLAARQQLLSDIEAELAEGRVEHARSLLESGRKEYLDSKTVSSLERKIERAEEEVERERSLRDGVVRVRDLILKGRFSDARSAIEELAESGLDDVSRAGLESELDAAEAAVLAARFNECERYEEDQRFDDALSCCREVLEIDGNHKEASGCVVRVPYLKVGVENKVEDKVKGYHRYVKDHPNSVFAKFALVNLKRLEEKHWESIKDSGEVSKHRLHLEIYPDGRFKDDARRRLAAGE